MALKFSLKDFDVKAFVQKDFESGLMIDVTYPVELDCLGWLPSTIWVLPTI